MTFCTTKTIEYARCKRRKVQGQFTGGDITSDGGIMLLREVDKKINLTKRIAKVFNDPRCKGKVRHDLLSMLRQRIYGISLGYEDLNDHDTLRKDKAVQTAVEKDSDLASASTLCRFENWVDSQTLWEISSIQLDVFIESLKRAPKELILDFDGTDDPVYGGQLGAYFHGYYDHHCFLPLYVFCRQKLLVSYLRPSNIDGAKHSWAILSLLVKRLRQVWPDVHIIFRGDSGFCRHKMFNWCEKNDVSYIVGIAKNNRLNQMADSLHQSVRNKFYKTGEKQR